jgi:hypothetical protein
VAGTVPPGRTDGGSAGLAGDRLGAIAGLVGSGLRHPAGGRLSVGTLAPGELAVSGAGAAVVIAVLGAGGALVARPGPPPEEGAR